MPCVKPTCDADKVFGQRKDGAVLVRMDGAMRSSYQSTGEAQLGHFWCAWMEQ